MKLIIGLGNPGEKYQNTRHNLGFMVLDQLAKELGKVGKTNWESSLKLKSDILQINFSSEKVLLVKPKTYMNNSGMAVSLISSFYKIKPEDVVIVHDDIDLPLGTIRIRFGGASAGHHGAQSIINSLGVDKFWRVRLGIGRVGHGGEGKRLQKIAKHKFINVEDYVLGNFSGHESGEVKKLIHRSAKALLELIENGPESSANKFNTR